MCQVCGLRRALPLTLITKAKKGRTINTPAASEWTDWAAAGAAGAAGAADDGQMGNASAEAAMTAAGGVAEDGPGAPLAITHGPAAEVLYEGTEYDVDMGNAAEASEATAAAAVGVRPTLPREEWDKMPRSQQRKSWMMRGGRLRCAPV